MTAADRAVDCDCEFDYPEPDGEESWHFTRVCSLCRRTWGALDCAHDDPGWVCRDCGRSRSERGQEA